MSYFAVVLFVRRRGLTLGFVAICAILTGVFKTVAQTDDKTTSSSSENQAPFRLQARSNLVVVRVVVRDSQGRPMGDLTKENFSLFDNGKEQTVSQFSVEVHTARTVVAPQLSNSAEIEPPVPRGTSVLPRALAFYFDDLNMAMDEINSARDAAGVYLAKTLRPPDRAAIFTSSGSVHTDFTSDLKTLHDALVRIIPIPNLKECPQISDYQAERIIEYEDPTAIHLAVSDAKMRCHLQLFSFSLPLGASVGQGSGGQPSGGKAGGGQAGPQIGATTQNPQPTSMPSLEETIDSPDPLVAFVKQEAEVVLNQSWQRSQRSLGMLNAIVLGMAHMSDQKEIILASPGFIPRNLHEEVDRVIDRALSSQIVINSLDPKGVALLMPALDVTSNYDPKLISSLNSFASSRELYASAVLAQIAKETGGAFFHHNNDLEAGFVQLADQPVSYTLAFAPRNLDGKFHKLQVKLKSSKGTIQARRGYFALKNGTEEEATFRQLGASAAEAQAQEHIREAVLSGTELHEFPVALGAKLSEGKDRKRELTMFAHLDAAPLRFDKAGEHNLNTVTFVTAVFDEKDNLLISQRRRARVNVLDEQLSELLKVGVDADMTFDLEPGIYRIRVVVMDSIEHHMTTISKKVKIP